MRCVTSITGTLLSLLLAFGAVAACFAEPIHHAIAARKVESNPEIHSMKIRLIINDQMLSATMEDSIPAREFIAQLPLTLQLEDYAATEKIAQLPRRLSVAGEQSELRRRRATSPFMRRGEIWRFFTGPLRTRRV